MYIVLFYVRERSCPYDAFVPVPVPLLSDYGLLLVTLTTSPHMPN